MAVTIGDLNVVLRAKVSQFIADMKKSTQAVTGTAKSFDKLPASLKRTSDALDDLAGTMGRVSIVSAGIATAIGAAGAKAVLSASDFMETSNVIEQSFGKQLTGEVEEWASTTAKAMGRSTQQMRLFAGNMGALIQPMIGNRKEAARMSKGITSLAVDLGSFFNVADEDAIAALRSGLVGESEPLKRFGIIMNEAALSTFAASKGITKLTKDMTNAEKTTLRYQFIMQATQNAQGDAVRTADGFANSLKALQGAFADAATDLGKALLPEATKLVHWARDAVRNFNELSPSTKRATAQLLAYGGAAAAATAAGTGLVAAIPPVLKGFSTMLTINKALTTALGVGLAPVLGVVAAGLGAFIGTLKLYEAATGESISLTRVLANTFAFATEGSWSFSASIRNAAAAVTTLLVKVFTLGAIDLTGVFASWGSSADDAAFRMEHLSKETNAAIAATENFPERVAELQKALRDLGAEERKNNPLSMGGEFGVKGDVFQFAPGSGKEGLKNAEKIVALNRQLRDLFEERERSLAAVGAARNKDAADRKKAADEAAAAAEKERKEAEAKAKAEAEAARKAAAVAAKRQEMERLRKKSPETIAKIELDAERELAFQAAQVAEPALRAILGAQDKIDELAQAFEAGGKALDDPRFLAAADMVEKGAMGQVRAFLDSKKETENFGEVVRKVAQVLSQARGGVGVTAEELGVAPELLADPNEARAAAQRAIEALKGSAMVGAEEFGTGIEDSARRIALQFGEAGLKAVRDGDIEGIVSMALESAMTEAAKLAASDGGSAPSLPPELVENIGGLAGDLGGVVAGAVSGDTGIGAAVGGALGAAIGAAGGPIGMAAGSAIGGAIEAGLGIIHDSIKGAFDFVADIIVGAAQFLSGAVQAVGDSIASFIPEERLAGAVQQGFAPVVAAIALAGTLVGGVVAAIGAVIAIAVPALILLGAAALATAFGLAVGFAALMPLIILLSPIIAVVAGMTMLLATVLAIIIAVIAGPLLIALLIVTAVVLAVAAVFAVLAASLAGLTVLVGIFAALITETESFKDLMLGFEASIDRVIKHLEPMGEMLVPLLGLFDLFMDILLVFFDSFMNVAILGPLLFDAFKAVLVGAGLFLWVVGFVQNAMLEMVAVISEGGAELVEGFAELLRGLAVGLSTFIGALLPLLATVGLAEAATETIIGLTSLATASDDAGESLRNGADTARRFKVDLDEIGALIVQVGNAEIGAMRERGQALIDSKKDLEDVNEQLLNIPEGFKVNLARWRSVQGEPGTLDNVDTNTGPGSSTPLDDGAASGSVWNLYGDLVITADDADTVEALERKFQQKAADQAGTSFPWGNFGNRQGR